MSMVNTQKVCLYGSILLVDYYYIMKTKHNKNDKNGRNDQTN